MNKLEIADKKGLLFDLDGTLVDSLDDLVVALNLTMEHFHFAPLCREKVSTFIGKGSRILTEKALRETFGHLPSAEIIERFHQDYLQNMLRTQGKFTRLFNQVPESLQTLRDQHFSLALVTNKPRINTELLLKQLRLDNFFDVIVAGDDTECPKPAPDMLHLACQKLQLHTHECIMIGDSLNDALAAQHARTACILLETGYNEGTNIREWARIHSPDAPIFANITDVVSYLTQ